MTNPEMEEAVEELKEMLELHEQATAMNNQYKPNRAERRAASKNSRKAARKHNG